MHSRCKGKRENGEDGSIALPCCIEGLSKMHCDGKILPKVAVGKQSVIIKGEPEKGSRGFQKPGVIKKD